MNRDEKIAYFTLHAKEHKLNSLVEPNGLEIPRVGEVVLIKETYKKGNQKIPIIECVVKEEYDEVIRVDVIKKINSKVSQNKVYTYSSCFRKTDFESGYLRFEHVSKGEVI